MVTRLLPRVRNGSVVVVDLDHFKLINDSLGHDAGDRVLRDFAGALSATARTADYVARTGGEEFLIVLDSSEPGPFVERLRQTWHATRHDPVTFSAGVAAVHDRAVDAVTAADRALYRAKRTGRDRWCSAEVEDYP
jgi:diguanylate cyclase (GGDEF)-like protein